MNMPTIRVELEGVRQAVIHAFCGMNNDLNELVIQTLEARLTESWVANEIECAVDQCIKDAIKDLSNNYTLKTAITKKISDMISEGLEAGDD